MPTRTLAAITLLLGVLAAACAPVTTAPPPPLPPLLVSVSAAVGLFPSFDPGITDYVDHCAGAGPVTVSVDVPAGSTVSVNGGPAQAGAFTTTVSQVVGQSITIAVSPSAAEYSVRCLPSDFPTWTVNRSGTPQSSGYLVAATNSPYPTIFDAHGVPVWWTTAPFTLNSDLLADGNVAWMTWPGGSAAEVRSLDGTLVHPVNTPADPPDPHDLLQLADGHYIIVTTQQVDHVDLSATGIPGAGSDASVLDHVVKELDAAGNVVWSWDVMKGDGSDPATEIPVTAVDPPWRVPSTVGPSLFDIYHWNSIEPVTEANGDPGFVLSFRHLDAVYNVDKTTKQVVWKLGGSAEAGRSLTVVDDPVFSAGGSLRGQHDARVLTDGSLTLYDDGSATNGFPGRAPRGVRYAIDTTSMTATLLESVSNAAVAPTSQCCGSARRLPGGDWVLGWGGSNKSFSEVTATGTPVFTLAYQLGIAQMYRAIPISAARWDLAAYRAGMDAQLASPPHITTSQAAGAAVNAIAP